MLYTQTVWSESAAPRVVSIEELRELQINYEEFVLVDVDPIIFNDEHIDGAINIPIEEISEEYWSYQHAEKIFKDKIIITYCRCGKEPVKAKDSANKFISLGYKRVGYLGSPEFAYDRYKKAGYPIAVNLNKYVPVNQISILTASGGSYSFQQEKEPESFYAQTPEAVYSRTKNFSKEKGFVLIDLRQKQEYKNGHIPYAQNIPFAELFNKSKETFVFETLPKDKEIIFYSSEDIESKIAVSVVKKAAPYQAYYMEGGYKAWNEKGYEIKK